MVAPEPLVSADIDISSLDGFMLNTVRVLGSELVALATPEEGWAAVLLWCRAWGQKPHCSLPDDDRVLASFAKVPPARWKKIKTMALRGFVKCSDGRLYHKVLAEDCHRAWEALCKRRDRTRAATEARKKGRGDDRDGRGDGPRNDGGHDPRDDDRNDRRDENRDDQRNEVPRAMPATGRDGTEERNNPEPPPLEPTSGTAAARAFADGFTALHRQHWPAFEEMRLLRRMPGSLVAQAQGWIDRGLTPDHGLAVVDDGMRRWPQDGEPPKGLKAFGRSLDAALSAKTISAAVSTSALSPAQAKRLTDLTTFIRFDRWQGSGPSPASKDAAQAEIIELEAKEAGKVPA